MPILNYPKLKLKDAPETKAFRSFERILKTDPTLSRVVEQWNSYNGDATDTLDPTPNNCPYLRLGLAPAGGAWEAEGLHQFPLLIGIQIAVSGTDVDQLTNFWHAIRSAVWPTDPARAVQVATWMANDGKFIRPTMTLCGYRTEDHGGRRMLVGEGTLEIKLHVSTP